MDDDCIIAQHEALTVEEHQSDKIPFVSVKIYPDFDLSYHLVMLFQECQIAILNSDSYYLI